MKKTVEEQGLVNTLKRLIGQYMPSELTNYEVKVKDFLDSRYSDLKKVESAGLSGLFYFVKNGRQVFTYYEPKKSLQIPQNEFIRMMELFEIDDDHLEYLIRDWFESTTNNEVKDFLVTTKNDN